MLTTHPQETASNRGKRSEKYIFKHFRLDFKLNILISIYIFFICYFICRSYISDTFQPTVAGKMCFTREKPWSEPGPKHHDQEISSPFLVLDSFTDKYRCLLGKRGARNEDGSPGNVLNQTVDGYTSVLVAPGVCCAALKSPGVRKQKIKSPQKKHIINNAETFEDPAEMSN